MSLTETFHHAQFHETHEYSYTCIHIHDNDIMHDQYMALTQAGHTAHLQNVFEGSRSYDVTLLATGLLSGFWAYSGW